MAFDPDTFAGLSLGNAIGTTWTPTCRPGDTFTCGWFFSTVTCQGFGGEIDPSTIDVAALIAALAAINGGNTPDFVNVRVVTNSRAFNATGGFGSCLISEGGIGLGCGGGANETLGNVTFIGPEGEMVLLAAYDIYPGDPTTLQGEQPAGGLTIRSTLNYQLTRSSAPVWTSLTPNDADITLWEPSELGDILHSADNYGVGTVAADTHYITVRPFYLVTPPITSVDGLMCVL